MVSSKYRKRLTVLVVIILLLLGAVLGVTIAYYQDHTGVIKNTFAPGVLFPDADTDFVLVERDIEVVKETDAAFKTSKYKLSDNTEATVTSEYYDVLPGTWLPKKPYIYINNLLLDAYLYVVVDTQGTFQCSGTSEWNSNSQIYWNMGSDWTFWRTNDNENKAIYRYTGKGTNANGVLAAGTTGLECIDIMKQENGYSIKVESSYNKTNGPVHINFTAYICQAVENSTYEDAWNNNFAAVVGF